MSDILLAIATLLLLFLFTGVQFLIYKNNSIRMKGKKQDSSDAEMFNHDKRTVTTGVLHLLEGKRQSSFRKSESPDLRFTLQRVTIEGNKIVSESGLKNKSKERLSLKRVKQVLSGLK